MVRERCSNRQFDNAFILRPDTPLREDGATSLFAVRQPLEVDLGCGRGRFLLARALHHPESNFLGVDRSLLRLQKLDRRAGAMGLTNIRLIQDDAALLVRERLAPGSVTAFYVYFPDPWPKRRHHPRRLVSGPFIDGVHRSLAPAGIIHLCTDHTDYFMAMRRLWEKDPRFESVSPLVPGEDEETDFGMLFRRAGQPINRCSFRKRPGADAG
jgi:tRNA (guanine-N7-)-methyltransferase